MGDRPGVREKWRWFPESRYGLFIHWGPYTAYGRGEQVVVREHLDPREYEERTCAWNPAHYGPQLWAETAKQAGFRFRAVSH